MKVIAKSKENLKVEVLAGNHNFYVEQPIPGMDKIDGPTPMEVLYGSLASCKVIMMKMYAMQRGWALSDAQVKIDYIPATEKDMDVENIKSSGKNTLVKVEIKIESDLDQDQREKLVWVAKKCPVHLTMQGEVIINTVLLD
jgi:uncharacterized OsmC-like protein